MEGKKVIRRKFKLLEGRFSFLLKIKILISISIEYYQPPQFFPILLIFTLKENIHDTDRSLSVKISEYYSV